MKILLGVIIGVTVLSFLLSENTAHGIWVPESPQELLNSSDTIFVGNITSVNTLQLEKQFSYITEENGTDKNFVQNYTIPLDQYQVNVEEFLKNPQNSSKMTVRQPTISAGPGPLIGFDKFNVGDHVLFYVGYMDGNNTYSPESFVIPEYCAGKNFDVLVYMTKSVGTGAQIVFNKEIHVESKPCQWIASAKWEFTPQEGKYGMDIRIRENGTISHLSDSGFSVKSNAMMPNNISPLQQFKSGIAANDVKCKQGLQLVIRAEDNSPACVKPQTSQKLVERGWGWAMQPMDSIKPSLSNRIPGLENDTGIVDWKNQTYYFETPQYTHDAYFNSPQISFHDVVFTLFPSGFRGGLPAWGCGGSYYWSGAKFSDGTSELLHIFVGSQDCSLPQPSTYFGTHVNPQAGLTFYDGKLKLLVSVEDRLQQNNSVVSTPIPTNETTYHDFPHPPEYSIINSTQGIIVNDDAEASNLTGFSVKSPTYLPQGYKVQLIKASKEIPLVTIFVSKYPLTENITSHDFLWNQQGILITYDKTTPFELENFKQLFPASGNKIITINDTVIVVSDISKEYHDGYPYDMWASLLAIQNNDTKIGIRGFFNSDELIKIATSMLEK